MNEVGGTSVLLLSSVPFEEFGYRTNLTRDPLPMFTYRVLSRIPDFVPLGGMMLGGIWWITHRREEVAEAEDRLMDRSHEVTRKERAMKIKITFWRLVFLALMAVGFYGTVVRFTQGLGASTNLNDQFPWGIWIGFDVLCGVMLAAGGFTLTAAVHIFNIKRLHADRATHDPDRVSWIRAGVRGAACSISGRPYRIWHPLVMRNPHSVMFEVAYCVMLYTTVLSLEFSPIVLERFGSAQAAEDHQGRTDPAGHSAA